MSHDHFQPDDQIILSEPQFPAASAQPQNTGTARTLSNFRRRWKLILLSWLVLSGGAVASILYWIKPTFTATAQVEVAPTAEAILYESKQSFQQGPQIELYLNDQAQLMASFEVLTAALSDPQVKNIPLVNSGDAMEQLREALTVRALPRTHLVEMTVTQDQPDHALRLTRAILEAYKQRAGGLDAQTVRTQRDTLTSLKRGLEISLERVNEQIKEKQEAVGFMKPETLNIKQQNLMRALSENQTSLSKAQIEVLDLEQQLQRLEKSAESQTMPAEEYANREKEIEKDPGIQWLQKTMGELSKRLAQLELKNTPDHPEVKTLRAQIAQFEDNLTRQRERIGESFDRIWLAGRKDRVETQKRNLLARLEAAKLSREVLQNQVNAAEEETRKIGNQAITMEDLMEQKANYKADYDKVEERIKQLDVESRRPTRITVASSPEIRPGGVEDKRLKLSLAAVPATLVLVLMLVAFIDRLSTQLHDPAGMEVDVGLRLLGAVPSIAELRKGTVTREDFLESYRVIRTTLAGASPDRVPPKTLLITSAQAAEGKSSLAISLAMSLAEPGQRVLLIDGDIQAPQVGQCLNLTASNTLKSVLSGKCPLGAAVVRCGVPGLDVLVGHANGESARGVLNTKTAARLVRDAAALYDHVIIDSPPALGAADALVWAHVADGVILSSLVGHTDTRLVRFACQRLGAVGAKILGAVIANVSAHQTFYSYSSFASRRSSYSNGDASSRRTPPLIHLPDEAEPKPVAETTTT
ncbi:MAG: AAA family ATPase [Phycisphaerae bacterium]|jgi:capsular exopolysaccharide synthesis family protein